MRLRDGYRFIISVADCCAPLHRDQLDVHEKTRREKELRDLAEDSNSFERAKQWAAGHRFAVVGGGWVAGMGVALGVIMRDPLQSFSQKLVQVSTRM